MSRVVMITEAGSTDKLSITEVAPPSAGPGQVRVRVKTAGLNPVDRKIISMPAVADAYGLQLPSGNGNDFAGVVDEIGEGVTDWKVGDEVMGGRRFYAQADYVVTEADAIITKPAALDWEIAGALDIVGRTAYASVRQVALGANDTVLVSAAAGGVGILAAQLAKRTGATVIGTASEGNHDFLRTLGVIPVNYGEGLVERIRALAPEGVTAVLDNNGKETIDAGLELGVSPARINTIADRPAAAAVGGTGVGGADASMADLALVADLIAAGEIVLPIERVFPLEQVRDAYQLLNAGHLRGKIVLTTE